MAFRRFAVCLALLAPMTDAPAMCLDGRHPGARDEFMSSAAVILGRVSKQSELQEDAADPNGVSAILYRVEVRRRLKGTVPRFIQLRSDNTSARFPMELGEEYLLFLSRDGHTYFVDSCGNSAPAKQAASVIAKIGIKK